MHAVGMYGKLQTSKGNINMEFNRSTQTYLGERGDANNYQDRNAGTKGRQKLTEKKIINF